MSRYFDDVKKQQGLFAKLRNHKKLIDTKAKADPELANLLAIYPHSQMKGLQFAPGKYMRTDNIDPKKINAMLADQKHRRDTAKSQKEYDYWDGMYQWGQNVSDLNPKLYDTLRQLPESMSNWLPQLIEAAKDSKFKIPATKVWTLPLELAQYLRLEYGDTNQESRDLFNQMVFKNFDLKDDKTYFIKTGNFSSKFEFRNTHCTEPREMGDYFSVITDFAARVGANRSMDLVVREWIDDQENRPTIYNGMPLHTEFRTFIDCDNDELIGTVPYWNPLVMKRALQSQGQHNPEIQQDYETYLRLEDTLNQDYNDHVSLINHEVKEILPKLNLHGKWSLDIMKNGDDFYLIDMARMECSALKELLPQPNRTQLD